MKTAEEFKDEPKKPEELVEFWMDDHIMPTQKFLEDEYWPSWDKYFRLDAGIQWDDYMEYDRAYFTSDNPPTKITVNMIGPPIRQLLAYALARRTYISCKPETPQAVVAAILAEAAANYEWKRNKFHPQVKKSFLESAIVGFCVGEVGWTVEVDESERPDKDGKLEVRDYIRKDSGYFRKIDCFKFGYDLHAPEKNLETARWCYEMFYQDPAYVVNNRFYDPAVRKDIKNKKEKPEEVVEVKSYGSNGNEPYTEKKLYCMYRLWDKKFKMMYIFCKGVKRPLVAQPWPWDYIDEFPIKMLSFIPCPYDYFPMGLVRWVEDLQFERNRTRTAMFHYRRTNVGGQIYVTDTLSEPERMKLSRGDKVIVGPEGSQKPEPIANAPLTPEQFAIDGILEADSQKIMGLPAWAQGGTSPGRRAATEIMRSAQFTELRIDGIIENLNEFIESIATDLVKHIKANYTSQKMMQLQGPTGEYWGRVVMPNSPEWAAVTQNVSGQYWVPFTQDDIQGEMDITVESTAQPKADPATELQNTQIFMQACTQVATLSAQTQMPPDNIAGVNFIELLRKMAETMGIKDSARVIAQHAIVPPPIQQQTALSAGGGAGLGAAPAPPVAEENAAFAAGANPQSALAGQILGMISGGGTGGVTQ